MHVPSHVFRVAFLLTLMGAMAHGQLANPVLDDQLARAKKALPVNRARVLAERKAAALPKADLTWFAVPAMSDRMRLHDNYPADGRLEGDLRVVVARDEFEPVSFVLFPFADHPEATLRLSPLKSKSGATIAPENLDLRVVKLWLQNGNGWNSYFADVGLKLVPELMLHDEKMVKVVLEAQANYARLKDKTGERHVWISSPYRLENTRFDPIREPFADSDKLQPFALEKDCFKQFFLTVHAPEEQAPGLYKGTVSVSASGRTLAEIPLSVRVLPFVLPEPHPYDDLEQPLVVSFFTCMTLEQFDILFDGDHQKAKAFYRSYISSMRDHGITYPWTDHSKESLGVFRELGMPDRPVMMGKSYLPWFGLNYGGRMSFRQMMTAKGAAEKTSRYYQDLVGHNDVLIGHGDEQGAAFVTAHRPFFKYFIEKGMKVGCAGHNPLLFKGGYAYGFYPMGGSPNNMKTIRPWKEMGGKYIGFYVNQHNGSENPQFVRMQHGLLGYFSGLNMIFNYEFAIGPWNDLALRLYKPMVVSYLNAGGLVETLAYSGFREGVDDIRYATYLKRLCQEAEASEEVETKLLGRKAMQYIALIPRTRMDLNVVRSEMVNHILKLREALGK